MIMLDNSNNYSTTIAFESLNKECIIEGEDVMTMNMDLDAVDGVYF